MRIGAQWHLLVFAASLFIVVQAVRGQSIAVISIAGDALTIVTAAPSVGSRLDRNHRAVVAIPDNSLDLMLLRQVQDAFAANPALSARWKLTLLMPKTGGAGGLRELQAEALGSSDVEAALANKARTSVAAALDGRGELPTFLLLVMKHRADALLRVIDGRIGVGRLDGLGFYVDRHTRLRRVDTGEGGEGFLAPFVYVKLLLVSVADGRLLGEEAVTLGTAVSIARSAGASHPWDIFTADQKTEALESLFREALVAQLPRLMDRATGALQR